MKAPSPAFSLYPKDIESDERCKTMTHAEFGMYMRLLLNCWTEGSIPADPVKLQRLLKVSSKTFKASWPAIECCFTPAGDRLTQSRLEEERTRQRERSLINSERGRKGGRPLESTSEAKPRLSPGKAEEKPDKSLPSPSSFPSPNGLTSAADEARADVRSALADWRARYPERHDLGLTDDALLASVTEFFAPSGPVRLSTDNVNLLRATAGKIRAHGRPKRGKSGAPSWDRGDQTDADLEARAVSWIDASGFRVSSISDVADIAASAPDHLRARVAMILFARNPQLKGAA